jgi:hypothetical protein
MPRNDFEPEYEPEYAPEEDYEDYPSPRRQRQGTGISGTMLLVIAVIAMLGISAAGAVIYAVGAANELNNAKDVLLLEVQAHNVTTNQLKAMTNLSNDRNVTIHQLSQNLTTKEAELAAKINQLATMTTNYNLKNAELLVAQTNITHLMANITALRGQLIVNKSYAIFKAFYQSDRTNNHSGMNGTYTAENYAKDFKANATKAYIRCAFVMVFLNNSTIAYINAVDTTTNGTIHINPRTDAEIAAPVVGTLFNGIIVNKIMRVW